jgi:hypothetical protein
MTGPPPMVGGLTKRNNRLLDNRDQPITVDAVKGLSRTQREALAAIAFPTPAQSGKRLAGGDKRLSEKSFLGGEPRLQLTILGQAIKEKLQ